jgi:ankyrin repeat protein
LITWSNLEDMIHSNDHFELKRKIETQPDFLFQTDEQGWSLLMISTNSSSEECSFILIEAGAKLNQKIIRTGKTALIIATTWGEYTIAQYLLEHGADVSIRDRGGESALEIAVKRTNGKDMSTWLNIFTPYKSKLDDKDLELYYEYRLAALFEKNKR